MAKILIIKKDLKDRRAGAPRIIFDQIQYFKSLGHEVHIAAETMNISDIESAGAIAHKTWKWPFDGIKRRMFFQKQALKVKNKIQPELVVGHGDTNFDDVSYIHNCVHLAHQLIHGKKIADHHPVGIIHAENLTSQNFKRIVTNSLMMRDDLISRFDIKPEIFRLEYPKYDQNKFYVNHDARKQMREKLNIENDELLIGLIISGNFKKRNVMFFLEVINELTMTCDKNFKVLIAGKNKDDQYQNYINEQGLNHRIQLAPSIDHVEDYYNAIDIFVLPAKIEEFGLSVIEAMACGNPILVSNTVGSGELLEGHYSEFRVDISREQFGKKLKKLIEDSNLRAELVSKGFEILKAYPKKYSFDHLKDFLNEGK